MLVSINGIQMSTTYLCQFDIAIPGADRCQYARVLGSCYCQVHKAIGPIIMEERNRQKHVTFENIRKSDASIDVKIALMKQSSVDQFNIDFRYPTY